MNRALLDSHKLVSLTRDLKHNQKGNEGGNNLYKDHLDLFDLLGKFEDIYGKNIIGYLEKCICQLRSKFSRVYQTFWKEIRVLEDAIQKNSLIQGEFQANLKEIAIPTVNGIIDHFYTGQSSEPGQNRDQEEFNKGLSNLIPDSVSFIKERVKGTTVKFMTRKIGFEFDFISNQAKVNQKSLLLVDDVEKELDLTDFGSLHEHFN